MSAELMLYAIDPERGGLLRRHRRQFKRALAAAGAIDTGRERRGWRLAARRARRRALRELRAAGLVARGRGLRGPRLVDRAAPGRQFRPLRDALLSDGGTVDGRGAILLLLLGYARLLNHRLTSRDDRRVAYRKLRRFIPQPAEPGRRGGAASPAPLNPDALALAGAGFLSLVDDFDFLAEVPLITPAPDGGYGAGTGGFDGH